MILNVTKCRISAIYQPAEQNLLHVENIYKETIDLRERPSRNSQTGYFKCNQIIK